MKKKLIAVVSASVLTLSMSTAVFAAPPLQQYQANGYGYGCGGFGRALMWDVNGGFVDQQGFERNLDQAIADGYIREDSRDYFAQMYDYCINYGYGGGMGMMGGRGGMGMMGGYYR